MRARLILLIMGSILSGLTGGADAGVIAPASFSFDVFKGDVVTTGQIVHGASRGEVVVDAVNARFDFTRGPSVSLGSIERTSRSGFGPHCGEERADPCESFGFDIGLGPLAGMPEGEGRLVVKSPRSADDLAGVDLYWDPTPPRARITSPSFNDPGVARAAWPIIATSPDENIIKITAKWAFAINHGRDIPTFEQHHLGNDLGPYDGHGSCAPTAVAANLQWLQNTAQGHTVPDWLPDAHDLVTFLGQRMGTGTVNCCTDGNGYVNGTIDYFDFLGMEQGVDYDFEIQNGAVTPEHLMEEFQAGGAITLGLHNPNWGHIVALSNVKLKANGDAIVTIMDPNVEPNPGGVDQGQFRFMTLHEDGTMDWDKDVIGYHNAPNNKVDLDGLHILRGFTWFDKLNAAAAAVVLPGGEIPGVLLPDGRTWVGVFVPPPGSAGPYLLQTESTDSSGHTQIDYQYVGGGVE